MALSQNGIYYNWGKCGEYIRTPKPTNFESFVDIYAKYLKVTHKAINFDEQKISQIIENFDVLNESNDEFKQKVKISKDKDNI